MLEGREIMELQEKVRTEADAELAAQVEDALTPAPKMNEPDYWVVIVKDPGDPEKRIAPMERRWRAADEAEAWKLYAGAIKAGYQADAQAVRRHPRNVPSVERTGR